MPQFQLIDKASRVTPRVRLLGWLYAGDQKGQFVLTWSRSTINIRKRIRIFKILVRISTERIIPKSSIKSIIIVNNN